MRLSMVIVILVIVLLLVLVIAVACFGSSGTPAAGEPTAAATEAQATTAPSTAAAEPTSENTAPAAEPTAATTAQPVQATALSNINLRGGPGTNYPVVGSLPAQASVIVVGRNEDGSWLAVETADGPAWVTADSNLVKVEGGAVTSLPLVEAPAVTYDAANPTVNLLLNQIPLVLHNQGSFTCVSHGGINKLSLLAEGNVIGPHAGDFVYGTDNVLFKQVNSSLHLIKENPIARFEGDAETLPFDRAMQLFASGEIVWTGQLGQSPGRGVAGCDPAAP